MSRLIQHTLLFAALAVSIGACEAAVIRGPGPIGPIDPPPDDPAAMFASQVEPLLVANCAGCHADPSATEFTFLTDDYYESVLAFPDLVVAGSPDSSRLIMKGMHRGPAWSAAEAQTVSAWITAEDGGMIMPPPPPPGTIVTSPYPVEDGEVRIPLAEAGLPGAELVFDATRIGSGMNMTNIFLVAGSTDISVAHPRFVVFDGGTGTVDTDRFEDLELRVNVGMTGLLSSQQILVGFPDPGELAVQFDSASAL